MDSILSRDQVSTEAGAVHSPDRVRTSPEEFLAVSGLSDGEQQLLRERYRWDDGVA